MANSQNPIAQILAPLRLDFSNVRPESGTRKVLRAAQGVKSAGRAGESGRWQERARNAATPPGGPRPAVIPAALHRGLIGCFPLLLLSSSVQACVFLGFFSLAGELAQPSVSGCQIVRYQIPTCSLHGTTHNHNRRVSAHHKIPDKKHHPHRPRKGPQAPQIPPRNRMTPRPRLPPASPGVPPVTRIFGAEGDDPTLSSSSSFARIVRHPGSAPKNEATTYTHPVISSLTRCGAGRRSVAGDHTQIFPKPRPSGCDL